MGSSGHAELMQPMAQALLNVQFHVRESLHVLCIPTPQAAQQRGGWGAPATSELK